MRYLLFVVLALSGATASAQSGVQNVHEVATSTNTIIQTVAVTSHTHIDIANTVSSGTLSGYFGIEVYNPVASASTIVCGFDVMLSTMVVNAWYGREVPAGVGVYWGVPSYRKLYCRTLSQTASTRVTVTQFK